MRPTVNLPVCIIALVMFSKSNLPTLLDWAMCDQHMMAGLLSMNEGEPYLVNQLCDPSFKVYRVGATNWRIEFDDKRLRLTVTVFLYSRPLIHKPATQDIRSPAYLPGQNDPVVEVSSVHFRNVRA